MADLPEYPLEKVLEIKENRVKEQEKVVEQKKQALAKEEEELTKVKEERDKVQNHMDDKKNQIRQSFDEGTTSDKIEQMNRYIDVVAEKLEAENQKVTDQEDKVEVAKKELEQAKLDLKEKMRQVDKLNTHKKEWAKEMVAILEQEEAKEMDEVGNILYMKHLREKSNFE